MKVSVSSFIRTGRFLAQLRFLACALGLLPAALGQSGGLPVIAVHTPDDTGANVTAWNAVQDETGVIHFGGHELISYDGQRWKSTRIEGSYAIRGLDFDREGKLWAGAFGELGWFDRSPDGWSFHSLRQHLPFDPAKLGAIAQVFAEANGVVFVAEDKILRWDGKSFQVWSLPGELKLRGLRVGGKIYIQHRSTGLYVMNADGPTKIIAGDIFGDAAIFWMEPRGGDNWFFVTQYGLFNFTDGRLEPVADAASSFIRRESLTCVTRLPDGRLALGTTRGGIASIRPDGAIDQILKERDGLTPPPISSLFVDAEKGLWAASSNRIFRVPLQSASVIFDHRAGIPAQQITDVLRHRGRLLLATENEVYAGAETGGEFQRIPELNGRVVDIRSSTQGLLLGRPRSASLWNESGTKVLGPTATDANIVKPSRLDPENILISAGRKILSLDGGGKPRILAENLPDVASSIAEDSRGQLWIGTSTRGVLIVRPNAAGPVGAIPPEAGLGLPQFTGFAAAIATKDGGIVVLAPEGGWVLDADAKKFRAIEHFPVGRKLTSYSYLAADDSVWVIHADPGVQPAFAARIQLGKKRAIWEPHSIEGLSEIGIPRGFFPEHDPAQGTTLWIGGTKGLLRTAVPNGPIAITPRAPLLQAYSRAAEATALQPITGALPYSTSSILFQFATPQFSLSPTLRLETFIEGIDRDWVRAEPSARRELTALRDSKYTFRVRAVAETGVASEPTSFDFEILPPWWRTTPAILAVLLALAPGAYGLYRLRIRALRRHNAELEQKVAERTAQLAKAGAAKTEFVANMSHDIRNPLNGIVGLALALEDTRLDGRQRELVATLRGCTTYLSSLVDDVLDFATIEAGQLELRPGPFAPAEVLRSVATTLKGAAAEEGSTILIEVDPKLPAVLLADAGRIQQILVNYAGNALKYAGGTVRLVAALPEESPGEIEFAVVDEGPGLTVEEASTLFTKFTRLPNARGDSIKGTGLGLAACRSLADIMGGSVGVKSQPGEGSRFFLRLPLTVSKPAETEPTFSLPATTVLLVEDEDYNAWAATAVLAKLGLTCERARDGAGALQLFAEKRFDIVLLDRNLPDMDGTEVARRIRAFEADDRRAILLAVTAYCTAADREVCLAAGMDAFVGKPLTPDKLRRVLLAAGRRLLAAASVQVPAKAEAPSKAAEMNFEMLAFLSDGSEEGLGEQVERFLATLAQSEEQLAAAAAARNLAGLADAAHHVLSQARMIGASALEAAAIAAEQAARARDTGAYGSLARVDAEIRAVKAALRRRHPAPHLA